MTDPADHVAPQEAIRRLLAEARHEAPVPPEVAARLDDTLARLHAQRGAEESSADVVDLSARRRRWRVTGLLAAAAVVVAGVAVSQTLPGASDSSEDARSSADNSASSLREVSPHSLNHGSAPSEGRAHQDLLKSTVAQDADGPAITLDDDLADTLVVLRTEATYSVPARAEEDRAACVGGPIGPGQRVDVQVNQEPGAESGLESGLVPGLVVYRPRAGDEQVADVFVCGDPDPVRTLTLPAP